jgi:oligopeptide transport system substrate-binding protein
MIDDMPIVPIVFYVNRAVVSPEVTGWEDNIVHIHRTRFMCLEGAQAEAGSSGDSSAD